MTSHDDRPFCGHVPRLGWRLPGLARRTRGIRVPASTDHSRDPAPEWAVRAGAPRSARDMDTGAAASAARERMRAFMGRSGGRGVTVTMIVNVLASVDRSTVRRWLAEDIKRGVAERVGPGFYRIRLRSDSSGHHRGHRGRLVHPERSRCSQGGNRRHSEGAAAVFPVVCVVNAGLLLSAGAWRALREPRQIRRNAAERSGAGLGSAGGQGAGSRAN